MDDRRLLKLAAKAGGIGRSLGGDFWSDARGMLWDPLTDDGDALRLAVQCGIEVSIMDDEPDTDGRFSRACAGCATDVDPRMRYVFENHKGDIFAATRRAIVRAAALIGEAQCRT